MSRMWWRIVISLIQIAVICFVTHSCSTKHDVQSIIDFPRSDVAVWAFLEGESYLPYPLGMFVNDSCVYVLGRSNHNWMHLYDKVTGNKIDSHIRDGNLYDGVLNGISLDYDGAEKSYGIFDSDSHCLKLYSESSIYKAMVEMNCLFRTVNGIYNISPNVCLVDAPVFYGDRFMGHSAIYAIDYASGEILSKYLEFPSDSAIDFKQHLMLKTFAVSNEKDRFVVLYPRTTKFALFELLNDSQICLIKSLEYENPNEDTSIGGFRSVSLTNKNIYISYSDAIAGAPVCKIGVWDWTGKPIRSIETDKDVVCFTVSNDESEVNAVVYDDEKNYQLAKIGL